MEEKITRLFEILTEAKAIIKEIEVHIEAKTTRKSSLNLFDIDYPSGTRSRFLNVCLALKIETTDDLLEHSSSEFLPFYNISHKTIKAVKEHLLLKYNINWK